jgi:uncharacterized protein YicC (UPF0701 family)
MNLYQIEKDINEKFNSLFKSGKLSLTLTLEESIKKINIQIDEPHDEDILQMKRDEYFKNKLHTCRTCKKIKSREEFFHTKYMKSGVSSRCKQCEMEYIRANKDKG